MDEQDSKDAQDAQDLRAELERQAAAGDGPADVADVVDPEAEEGANE